MTPGGWIVMLVSVLAVSSLFVWCIYKVVTTPGETEHIHDTLFEPDEEKDDEPRT